MKRITQIFIVIIILMTFFPAGTVYGYNASVCDNEIEIEVPDDWSVTESDDLEDSEVLTHILFAKNEEDESSPDLNLFYLKEESNDYIYFTDDSTKALEYYEDYGRQALEDYYGIIDDCELISLSEPDFYNGEWNGFLKVTATVTGENGQYEELIYLTATEDIVHQIFVFSAHSSDYIAADLTSTAEPIIESFFDYGYAEDVINTEDGGLLSGLISILIPILIVVAAVVKVLPKYKRGKKVSPKGGREKWNPVHKEKDRSRKPASKEKNLGWKLANKTIPSLSKDNIPEAIADIPETFERRPSDAGEKYIESLHTLYKSGLLTKNQLDEMINKYLGRR